MTDQETINELRAQVEQMSAVLDKRIGTINNAPIPYYLVATYAVLTDIYNLDPEARNFLQHGWTWIDGEQEEHYSVLIQRTGGETPAALAVRMKRENAALRAEIEALKAARTLDNEQADARRIPGDKGTP